MTGPDFQISIPFLRYSSPSTEPDFSNEIYNGWYGCFHTIQAVSFSVLPSIFPNVCNMQFVPQTLRPSQHASITLPQRLTVRKTVCFWQNFNPMPNIDAFELKTLNCKLSRWTWKHLVKELRIFKFEKNFFESRASLMRFKNEDLADHVHRRSIQLDPLIDLASSANWAWKIHWKSSYSFHFAKFAA